MLNIVAEQITHQLTWRLRQQVLYPDKAIGDMALSGDEDGIHYGAFAENKLTAVVSTFWQGTHMQLRKLAVTTGLQRQGIGSEFLQYVIHRARESGATRVWCNARVSAGGFYLKAGFKPAGEAFTRDGIDYIVMDKLL